MLNSRSITALLSLAKTRSFQISAQHLGVSNATLTRYIQNAETEAGFSLFDRKRGKVELTERGQEFLPLVEELASNLEVFSDKTQKIQTGALGLLRIGCGPLTTRTLIRPVLSEILKSTPELRCEITVQAAVQPLKQLAQRHIDVFVGDMTHTPEAHDVELEIQTLKKQSVIFVAGSNHVLHREGPQSLSTVLEYPFACPPLHKHWRASLAISLGGDIAAAEKVKHLPQVTCDDYATITDLLYHSDFVAGGMRETFSESLALGLVKEIKLDKQLEWNICAARRLKNNFPAADAFWNALCTQFGSSLGVKGISDPRNG